MNQRKWYAILGFSGLLMLATILKIRNKSKSENAKEANRAKSMGESQVRPERESLETEYQACEDEINANASNYWLISTIFIGISTALLGALLYAVLGSDLLLNSLIYQTSTPEAYVIRFVVLVIGGGCLIILLFLKRWLGRVDFLIRMRHRRMHEIEAQLGMWASRTIHIIDNWDDLNQDRQEEFLQYCKIRVKPQNQKKLIEALGAGLNEYWTDNMSNSKPFSYAPQARGVIYKVLMLLIEIIWALFIFIVWLPLIINLFM